MNAKEFYALMETIDPEDYPFGSCQYQTVYLGFMAARKLGAQNLGFFFPESCFIENMKMKGKKEELLRDFKKEVLYGFTKAQDEADEKKIWDYLDRLMDGTEEIILDYFWEEELDIELKEIIAMDHPDDLLEWLMSNSWDLWSVPIPLYYPEVNLLLAPDVGPGPVLNVMAWEDGYAQGITMAIFEYLYEEEINWGNGWAT